MLRRCGSGSDQRGKPAAHALAVDRFGHVIGGAHHTGYSYSVTTEHMDDLAEIAGVELVVIDGGTELRDFKQKLRQNEIYYHLAPGLGRL